MRIKILYKVLLKHQSVPVLYYFQSLGGHASVHQNAAAEGHREDRYTDARGVSSAHSAGSGEAGNDVPTKKCTRAVGACSTRLEMLCLRSVVFLLECSSWLRASGRLRLCLASPAWNGEVVVLYHSAVSLTALRTCAPCFK